MPRYLRLRTTQNLHKIADANLLLSHQVEESEPGVVAERLKEPFHIEGMLCSHEFNIYALTY